MSTLFNRLSKTSPLSLRFLKSSGFLARMQSLFMQGLRREKEKLDELDENDLESLMAGDEAVLNNTQVAYGFPFYRFF